MVVGAAEVGGPGVADGELVELQHVHDADLSDGAAEQLWPLVDAGRWEREHTVRGGLHARTPGSRGRSTYLRAGPR